MIEMPLRTPSYRAMRSCSASRSLLAALAIVAFTGTACGDGAGTITKSDDPRSGAKSGFDTTAPAPTSEVIGGTTVPGPGATTPTTTPVPTDPGAALLDSIAAYGTALGTSTIRTLQFMIQFPETGSSYGSLQSQDPAVPTHVDQRDWRDGAVGDPAPVTLTGSGDLEANLFSLDEINWPAVAGVIPTAQAAVEGSVGPLEGSRGVTHLIAERNLPFTDQVVVRVYVDGGPRSTGGYVQYLADGTLDKVQA
jgi:hypothetical protein